jgi:hypothetical protein
MDLLKTIFHSEPEIPWGEYVSFFGGSLSKSKLYKSKILQEIVDFLGGH